ncbi:MAG: right-handed parallel beta-helix repeat-containing protein [Candidatus Thorarchaeota archaeon]
MANLVAFGLVLGLILLAFPESQTDIFERNLSPDIRPNNILADYEIHDPILIESDDDFVTQGWPGSGTAEDPYVIEGLWIERVYEVRNIVISSTTVDFIIRNCYLEADIFGIQLGWTGSVAGSVRIHNNSIIGDEGEGYGINVGGVINSTITQNIVYDCYTGIHVSNHISTETANHTIDNNTCFDNSLYGIWSNSPDTMISNNTCYNNGWSGIYTDAENSDNPTLIKNTCYGNGYLAPLNKPDSGIFVSGSETALVLNNTCYVNYVAGITIGGAGSGVQVINNTCINNQYGICNLGWASNATIYSNVLGWNHLNNSLDETVGVIGKWDDGISIGNFWGDYNGTYATYPIPGPAGAVDNYPSKADTKSPTIEDLEDFESEAGLYNSMNWTSFDDHPDSFIIYRDESPIDSGAWDGIPITVPVIGLDLGVYNFTLTVYDTCANFFTSQVNVTVVDTTPPNLTSPPDFSYDHNSNGNEIEWIVDDIYPSVYRIDGNATTLDWTSWTSGTITIDIDGLGLGVYNYTISLLDTSDNLATSTVHVTVVDGTPPTIDAPEDITYDEGDTGYAIIWTPSDLFPVRYEIEKDGIVIASGSWNLTGESLSINVDGLQLGVYYYTARIFDNGSNMASDTVKVTVLDGTDPSLNDVGDFTYEAGETGNSIVWMPQDKYPSSYSILLNGNSFMSGEWTIATDNITISVDDLGLGMFNFTIIAYDIGGNSAKDTVIVTVEDTTLPTIDSPADITYEVGETGFSIVWSPSDLLPDSFDLLQNSYTILSDDWSGPNITYSVDGFPPGIYNFTLIVYDTSGNWVADTVIVTVTALITSPTSTTTTTTAPNTTGPPANPTGMTIIVVVVGVAAVTSIIITLVVLRIRNSR